MLISDWFRTDLTGQSAPGEPGGAQGSQGSLEAAGEPGFGEAGKGSGRLGGAVEAEGSLADEEKNNSFGDGLREPKPLFSFVFSMFPWPGGPWGIKKHCFFIGFSRFWRSGPRETK